MGFKIPSNSKDITQRFLFSLFDTSITQQILERCKRILFLIAFVFQLLWYLIFFAFSSLRLLMLQNDNFLKFIISSTDYEFFFHRKIMHHCQDIKIFVFLNILWFTKSILTSLGVLLENETGCTFEYILWTATH